jgi:rhomboid protease GluP
MQYEHILQQIKANFSRSYPQNPHLLSLIFTREPNRAKLLCAETQEDSHWIIDTVCSRLMIYETQSRDFTLLQRLIEQLLAEEQEQSGTQTAYESGYKRPEQVQMMGRKASASNLLTAVNTGIIVINFLAFLFTQYVPVFGGKEAMLEKGALSWYFVKEHGEYYRILTAMFLHSGWDHLVNNMIVLLFIGSNLERATGRVKYLFIYLGSGIIAGICSISYNMWKEYEQVSFDKTTISIGASGAIFCLVGAILFIVIINRGRLEEISTRQMILFIILSLYGGIVNSQIDQAAHIGGFVAGIILTAVVYRRPERQKIQ